MHYLKHQDASQLMPPPRQSKRLYACDREREPQQGAAPSLAQLGTQAMSHGRADSATQTKTDNGGSNTPSMNSEDLSKILNSLDSDVVVSFDCLFGAINGFKRLSGRSPASGEYLMKAKEMRNTGEAFRPGNLRF